MLIQNPIVSINSIQPTDIVKSGFGIVKSYRVDKRPGRWQGARIIFIDWLHYKHSEVFGLRIDRIDNNTNGLMLISRCLSHKDFIKVLMLNGITPKLCGTERLVLSSKSVFEGYVRVNGNDVSNALIPLIEDLKKQNGSGRPLLLSDGIKESVLSKTLSIIREAKSSLAL
ncbi:MAG: hypothetical protein ABIF08_04625 [Nanoarchaeota archaeon]